VAVGVFSYFSGRKAGGRPLPDFTQLTFRRGYIHEARFAPDGQTLVYSAAWEGQPARIFVGRPGSAEATPLSPTDTSLLAVSSSGRMAVELAPQNIDFAWKGTLAEAPLAGGAPRELLEAVEWADWSRDGKSLAIVRDAGGKNRLEFPVGKPLYETAGFLTHPRVSPGGDLVAFLDHPSQGDDGGSVAVVDGAGRRKTLSDGWHSVLGLSWAPGAREIWFTGTRSGGNRSLWAVSLDGRERLLAKAPGMLTLHDVAQDGRVLLTHDSARVGILGLAPGDAKERDLSWLDWSLVRDLSPDGKTLLFDESGQGGGTNYSIYVRKTDGSPAVRLGEGAAFALSPDGKWVASVSPAAAPRPLVLLPTGPGEPRSLPADSINHNWTRFFGDGRRILFAGDEPKHGLRLYVQDLSGGPPRPVSPEGVRGFPITVSPDGKWVSAVAPDGKAWLYPVEGGQPVPVSGLSPGEGVTQWTPDERFLYVRDRTGMPAKVFRMERETGRRELWKELMPSDSAGLLSIFGSYFSADGRSYAYSYARNLSDLYLVEGVK
jgi:eukaryotic-like serine/threonine-protein kinase